MAIAAGSNAEVQSRRRRAPDDLFFQPGSTAEESSERERESIPSARGCERDSDTGRNPITESMRVTPRQQKIEPLLSHFQRNKKNTNPLPPRPPAAPSSFPYRAPGFPSLGGGGRGGWRGGGQDIGLITSAPLSFLFFAFFSSFSAFMELSRSLLLPGAFSPSISFPDVFNFSAEGWFR